jgi:hypothetical protein
MKLFFFLFPILSFAQQTSFRLCDSLLTDKWKPQYYSFNTKYPLSSEKLTEEVNRTLTYQPKQMNGFVTIRFVVNCKGQTGNFEIYQIDNSYQQINFEEKYIEALLTFVKTLENWKIGTYESRKFDYYAYFTFKIEYGKVTEIVP